MKPKFYRMLPFYLILILLSLFFLFPFFMMISTSLKAGPECYELPVRMLPKAPNFQAYIDVFEMIPFPTYLKNTVIIAVFNIIGVLFSCPLAAYSLSRINWSGKKPFFAITLAVMMIPGAVTMVPVYLMFNYMGLVGGFAPLIIPAFLGSPFYIFMLRQFFLGLPKSLEEAAVIDGCSSVGIYFRIFLPLMKPALSTIAVLQLSGVWNDFMGPLIYLSEESKYTLQIGLQQFRSVSSANLPPKMAMAVMITIPILILFFFAQKQFTEGITFTGSKG